MSTTSYNSLNLFDSGSQISASAMNSNFTKIDNILGGVSSTTYVGSGGYGTSSYTYWYSS